MSHFESPIREPLITGNKTWKDITNDIVVNTTGDIKPLWLISVLISAAVAAFGVYLHWMRSLLRNWNLGSQ